MNFFLSLSRNMESVYLHMEQRGDIWSLRSLWLSDHSSQILISGLTRFYIFNTHSLTEALTASILSGSDRRAAPIPPCKRSEVSQGSKVRAAGGSLTGKLTLVEYSLGQPIFTSMAATSFSLWDKIVHVSLIRRAQWCIMGHKMAPTNDTTLKYQFCCSSHSRSECVCINVFLSTQVSLTVRDEAVDSHEPGHDQRSVWISSSLKKEKQLWLRINNPTDDKVLQRWHISVG